MVKITSDRTNKNQKIDPSAIIGENVTLGNNIKIGAHTRVLPGAVIMDNVEIKDHVIIGPNAVIGHNAFYYNTKNKKHKKHPRIAPQALFLIFQILIFFVDFPLPLCSPPIVSCI